MFLKQLDEICWFQSINQGSEFSNDRQRLQNIHLWNKNMIERVDFTIFPNEFLFMDNIGIIYFPSWWYTSQR